MPLPIAPIVAGVAICAIWRARPSTLLRLVEDTAIAVPRAIARGTSKRIRTVVHDVRIEYDARQLARMQERIVNEQALLRTMSERELKALAKDQARILARAEELRTRREERRPRSAAGSSAHV